MIEKQQRVVNTFTDKYAYGLGPIGDILGMAMREMSPNLDKILSHEMLKSECETIRSRMGEVSDLF